MPAHRARIGNFDTLRTGNNSLLESALAKLAADSSKPASAGLQLLATYYRSGFHRAAIDQQGLAPVAPLLAAISRSTRESLRDGGGGADLDLVSRQRRAGCTRRSSVSVALG